MGEVQVGDQLIGADGKPTRVVAATEVMHRTKKLMEMPGNETMSYRQAHSVVLMNDTVLAERYRREQTKLVL